MKKKLLVFLLVFGLCTSFAACTKTIDSGSTPQTETASTNLRNQKHSIDESVSKVFAEDKNEFTSGRYEILSCSANLSGIFGWECSLHVQQLDTGITVFLDGEGFLTNTCITEFFDMVYLDIVRDGDTFTYDLVLKDTNESILDMSPEDTLNMFRPEIHLPQKPGGEYPETFYISQYEPGYVYEFEVNTHGWPSLNASQIINDTDIPIVGVTVWAEDSIFGGRTFAVNRTISQDDSFYPFTVDHKTTIPINPVARVEEKPTKVYYAVFAATPEDIIHEKDIKLLSKTEVGDAISTSIPYFVYNDTPYTAVIVDTAYRPRGTIAPNEVVQVPEDESVYLYEFITEDTEGDLHNG